MRRKLLQKPDTSEIKTSVVLIQLPRVELGRQLIFVEHINKQKHFWKSPNLTETAEGGALPSQEESMMLKATENIQKMEKKIKTINLCPSGCSRFSRNSES